MRYNLNSEGYITEIGLVNTYEFPVLDTDPVNMSNFKQWRKVDGEWCEITVEQYELNVL